MHFNRSEYDIPLEKILDHRLADGHWQFLVQWAGFPPEDATWEQRKCFRGQEDRITAYFKDRQANPPDSLCKRRIRPPRKKPDKVQASDPLFESGLDPTEPTPAPLQPSSPVPDSPIIEIVEAVKSDDYLKYCVRFANGKLGTESSEMLRRKCPGLLMAFLEALTR
jgi:hypothetical protein